MNTVNLEEGLRNILEAEQANLPRQLDWFLYRRDSVSLGSILRGISGLARTEAIYAYFVKRDIATFKQNCYLATKLTLASVGQHGGADFSVGSDFLYALLSDNIDVINALAYIETPELMRERRNPLSTRSHVYMLQLAIRDDTETLQQMIEKVAKNGRKRERAEAMAESDFFSLLLKRDQSGLEELIQNRHALIKSADPRTENFMSFLGTLETKLCWLKGIPVVAESPLVPMELMPVRPLKHYADVYDFLKPGWVPPQQGLLGKVSRFFSNKK